MKNKINKKNIHKRGFSIIGILFFGFIIILVLSFFDIRIKGVVEGPAGQENISYVEKNIKTVWNKYFKGPARYLWNDIWLYK